MSKIHLVLPDSHAHPDHNNDRANWVGKLIKDLKPDVVINIGDMFDLPSMSSYDKGKRSFQGRAFKRDMESGLDFDERMWHYIRKSKKKRPTGYFFEGNHENRLKKLLEVQPELEGTVGFKDFNLERNYNEVIEYTGGTPGIQEVDGVNYAHFFISGVMGRSIGGEHHAYSLLSKHFASCTCGHSHTTDFAMRTDVTGRRIQGLVSGVFQDYDSGWAGEVNKLWWQGLVIKRNVEGGVYDPQWVSMDALKKEYGDG